MNRYLLEVIHEGSKLACDRAIRLFNQTGSHFLTNADWGCADEEHKAWIIVDTDTKEEAMMVIPHEYRKDTKIIRLEKFSVNNPMGVVVEHPDL